VLEGKLTCHVGEQVLELGQAPSCSPPRMLKRVTGKKPGPPSVGRRRQQDRPSLQRLEEERGNLRVISGLAVPLKRCREV
jgi:hypothetical protein